jgi:hypothetical protein
MYDLARETIRNVAVATVLILTSCSTMKAPDAQSIAGVPPSGTVTLNETFVAGYGGGDGTLMVNGSSHPFKLIGAVVGPGGAERVTASGEIYKLKNLSDFAGRYSQWSGAAGLARSGSGELWLEKDAGIIMHLYSQTEGILLSMGTEQIFIHLDQ